MSRAILQRVFLISADCLAIFIAFIGAILVTKVYHEDLVATPLTNFFNPGVSKLLGLSLIIIFAYYGHYSRRKPFWEELLEVAKIILVLFILNLSVAFILQKGSLKVMLTVFWLSMIIFFPLFRLLAKSLMLQKNIWQRDLFIVGVGIEADNAFKLFARNNMMGYQFQGFIQLANQKQVVDSKIISQDCLIKYYQENTDFDVVVALPTQILNQELTFINQIQHHCLSLMILPAIQGVPIYGAEINHFFGNEQLVIRLNTNLSNWFNRLIKRCFDLVVCVIILLLIAPFMLIIAMLIKFTTKGNVFFKHTRIGKDGKHFSCLKFQTMYPNSKELLEKILLTDPLRRKEWETSFKLKNDPRVTKIGKFLRETSLDELPQLFNVLLGQMSLVGPRPIIDAEIERYQDSFYYYKLVLPGITGLWQISGRSDIDYTERVNLDECYVRNWSLWYDIVILIKTINVVIKKTGAY